VGTSQKSLTVLLIVALIASGLMLVGSASAQSTPKPSAPQFTLQYADFSYDVPSTTSTVTDPFTGKQITTTNNGYHVDNRTIILKIKNQPIPQTGTENPLGLYYYVRFKGHYENNESDWMYLPKELKYGYGPASNSVESVWYYRLDSLASQYYLYFSDNSEIDFQVQALIGNQTLSVGGLGGHYVFTGEKGEWSNTQTVTIGSPASATPTPSIPEFPAAVVLPLFAIMLLVAALLRSKDRFSGGILG
jgi:hypothetical protein